MPSSRFRLRERKEAAVDEIIPIEEDEEDDGDDNDEEEEEDDDDDDDDDAPIERVEETSEVPVVFFGINMVEKGVDEKAGLIA